LLEWIPTEASTATCDDEENDDAKKTRKQRSNDRWSVIAGSRNLIQWALDEDEDQQQNNSGRCRTIIQRFEGHTAVVSGLAQLGEDGFVSSSFDQTLKHWCIHTGACLRTLSVGVSLPHGLLRCRVLEKLVSESFTSTSGSSSSSSAAAASAIFAVGGGTKCILLWNLNKEQPLTTLVGHEGCIQDLCELDDGRIASASLDRTMRLWKVSPESLLASPSEPFSAACRCELTFRGHRTAVRRVIQWWPTTDVDQQQQQQSHHKLLMTCSQDGTIRLWSTEVLQSSNSKNKSDYDREGTCLRVYTGTTEPVVSLIRWSPESFVSGSYELKGWNATTSESLFALFPPTAAANLLKLKPKPRSTPLDSQVMATPRSDYYDSLLMTGDLIGELTLWKMIPQT